ncbi:hypothetical protein [Phaffia rhodozyma]|uniref:Uncharacterized protein n=1 Tax=Phaffia rhodozyma TaxID=264483 RepID=A0A0F7SR33_PHARH|nr:hypothetical protein [Phaffia rhodozyma]
MTSPDITSGSPESDIHLLVQIQLKDDPPGFTLVPSTQPRYNNPKNMFPSPPVPALPSSPPSLSSFLPSLPEPLFLPSPYSPAHPAFHALSSKAERYLDGQRTIFLSQIERAIQVHRERWDTVQDQVKREVSEIWELFEKELGETKYKSQPDSSTTTDNTHTTASVGSTPNSPRNGQRTEGFVPSKVSSSAETSPSRHPSAEPKRSKMTTHASDRTLSPASNGIGSRPVSSSSSAENLISSSHQHHGPSLLGASLRNSYMPNRSIPSTSTSHSLSVLNGIAHVKSSNASSSVSSRPIASPTHHSQIAACPADKDMATSLLVSNWTSPPNLIFRGSTVNQTGAHLAQGVTGVGPGVETRKVDTAEVVSARPEDEATRGLERAMEEEKRERSEKRVKKRVAFKEADNEEEKFKSKIADKEPKDRKRDTEEEEEDEGNGKDESDHEDVFDFEPPLPHASFVSEPSLLDYESGNPSSLSLEPLSSLAPSGTGLTDEKVEEDEPMYALDGSQSLRAVTSTFGGRGDAPQEKQRIDPREVEREQKQQSDVDRVAASMGKLTAAYLPSHRAASRDKDKKWHLYGRLAPPPHSLADEVDSSGPKVHYGQSLPIAIALPSNVASQPGAPQGKELERKTSLADREMFVPPLRKAMRVASKSPSTAARRASTSPDLTDHPTPFGPRRVYSHPTQVPSPIPESPQSTPPPPPPPTLAPSDDGSALITRVNAGTQDRPSYLSKRTASYLSAASSLDPGPMLEQAGGDSDPESDNDEKGFIAPHLKSKAERGTDVGWASLVDR